MCGRWKATGPDEVATVWWLQKLVCDILNLSPDVLENSPIYSSSHSTLSHLNLYMIPIVWPVVLKWSCIGEGGFRCSLNPSPNVLEDSPICSSSHSTLSHLNLYMMPLFLVIRSLSLGATRGPWWFCPLWSTLVYHVSCKQFYAFTEAFFYMVPLNGFFLLMELVLVLLFVSFLVLLLLPLGWLGSLILAHRGYLHQVRTFWRCSCSSCNCYVVDLWKSVLIILYYADMAWWLPHCKYWPFLLNWRKLILLRKIFCFRENWP